ncbi:MAG: DUF3198 domain-containing protein [Thermoplasmata archaeon]|nr:DUF3198 domain-containing protein [Thermoplasmata archaeon]MCI4359688.1 DUF3198 domain-containing protein [Thermoplasmata archaeon]
MPPEEAVPWSQRIRRGARVHRALLSVIVLATGVFLTALAIGDYTPLSQNGGFHAINAVTDLSASNGPNYNLVFVILGPILVIVGGYLVGSYYVSRTRFEHLMLSRSKAEFLRNLPEVEDLLWDLTPNDEQRYELKKSELRIRR